ncbi:ATP-binding cassette domain-containing protein [Candidatus Methylospira mobilis]|uniref:ATP-binding cassette domain-containing protein n=1 Tax=Candidatus Methylospira mobilis TaxID=1808979 RepID=A0A5Q0BHC3_9GAMM|nr:ATP-binding cassette domain-containing protein [Candidatus Methylospira mobilis]QFY41528.1 ATP-binding cassette domain-containing protein [Candidatus Methylospira mobilis]
MRNRLLSMTLAELSEGHPGIAQFIASTDARPSRRLDSWLDSLDENRLSDLGMDRERVLEHLEILAAQVQTGETEQRVRSLTILGGHDKSGQPENLNLMLKTGDVLCIVGPTGSGKSRLLADIECLAQGDTPSGRRVLVNDAPPEPGSRFTSHRRLIAQLSQNMNFVVDLSVGEFLFMHADCRRVKNPETVVADVIACANELAGERFTADVSLTQLSGGQTRALMIADTALLSASPVVLIDEIENAGIDRKKSLDLLIAKEKIVLISTHDPILALMGSRRIVIRNGAVADFITTSEAEKANLSILEHIDQGLMDLRHQLRMGRRIETALNWTLE